MKEIRVLARHYCHKLLAKRWRWFTRIEIMKGKLLLTSICKVYLLRGLAPLNAGHYQQRSTCNQQYHFLTSTRGRGVYVLKAKQPEVRGEARGELRLTYVYS